VFAKRPWLFVSCDSANPRALSFYKKLGFQRVGRLPDLIKPKRVELLPYGSELGSTCTCEAWADPCPHALAVMYQLAWLMEDDPFVLLHLRGLGRDGM